MVTKEQFMEWKVNPVTIEVYEEIRKMKESLKDKLSEGLTIDYSAEGTHGKTNKMVGQIEGLNQLLNLTYEDSEEVETIE
jgi:hypothetical protein